MSSPVPSEIQHRISSGETLSGIADQHGVTVRALLLANPQITNPNRIIAGQTILIPAPLGAGVARQGGQVDPSLGNSPPPLVEENREDRDAAADPNAILNDFEPLGASDRTARQDGLPQRGIRGVRASEQMARTDRMRVMRQKAKFRQAARRFPFPPALLAAIASRESRGGAALDSRGFGDRGHGFGLMQVDIGNPFPVVTEGGRFGQPHIDQATGILQNKLEAVRERFPQLSEVEQLQGAVSRYNGGQGLAPPNSDEGTTGGDYMNDVWARARFYAGVEDWSSDDLSPI